MISTIKFLAALGEKVKNDPPLSEIIERAYYKNNWFTPSNSNRSLQSICNEFLNEEKLQLFAQHYAYKQYSGQLAIILAGNIPLVGFHDILCGYLCGAKMQIKLSTKDDVLTKYLLLQLKEIDPKSTIEITEKIDKIDKVIATGSSNTNRYFDYYFNKYPHLLRSNRTSVAVLDGNETEEELDLLMDDIFLYFGLGCRNVSKIFIPRDYPLNKIFEHAERYSEHFNHQKYMNNYEYNRTVYLLNKIPHLCNDFFILKEDKSIFSPISVVYYEYYDNLDALSALLEANQEYIQCVVSNVFEESIPFGKAQTPSLFDYADGVDTMKFILD
jgi:hypothetical protein